MRQTRYAVTVGIPGARGRTYSIRSDDPEAAEYEALERYARTTGLPIGELDVLDRIDPRPAPKERRP